MKGSGPFIASEFPHSDYSLPSYRWFTVYSKGVLFAQYIFVNTIFKQFINVENGSPTEFCPLSMQTCLLLVQWTLPMEQRYARCLYNLHNRISMWNKNCRAIGLPRNFEINILKICDVSFFTLFLRINKVGLVWIRSSFCN